MANKIKFQDNHKKSKNKFIYFSTNLYDIIVI